MNNRLLLIFFGLAISTGPASGFAEEDLIALGKADSGVKPLVFPLSMKVVHNRPQRGFYYFYENDSKKYDEGLAGTPVPAPDALDLILSSRELMGNTLVKTDPVRIVPSSQARDLRGPVTRSGLKEWKQHFTANVLFVFRREITLSPEAPLPPGVFLKPHSLLEVSGAYKVTLRTSGLLYLTRQNKVLSLKPDVREASLAAGSDKEAAWKTLAEDSLKQLAAAAKKTFHDHRFFKRQSAY